jgi:transposase
MARFDTTSQISRELLNELYIEQSLTASEIAQQLGCGETTVLRALHKYEIPKRSKRDYRLELSREDLERLDVVEHLSESEVAERLNVSQLTVSRRLQEFGIPTRSVGSIPSAFVSKQVLRRVWEKARSKVKSRRKT